MHAVELTPTVSVQRAQLVLLAAVGISNTEISEQLQLSRKQVRQWRQRWSESAQRLEIGENEGISDRELKQQIEAVLSDEQRPGGPAKFSKRADIANSGSGV